ncbi:hypothetical protein [Tomitella fengzijianii]|uniref:Uncharacterized protein n=1 Tax=Tomitella fengzijianii TaxID=2597660 RepID=A0A516X1P2_9ACTN|nr:hypothetical protein [Tomitella fengzijianii]QDQ96973.1 hypothetical protein FO059_06030 [Tomitella fengzijianii]
MNDAPTPPITAERAPESGATARQAAGAGHPVSTAIIRLGIVLFAVGLVAIAISFAAPVFNAHLSTYFYFAAMLCPLGMIVGVAGALVSGRRERA